MSPPALGVAADLRARAEAQLQGQGKGAETDSDPHRLRHELEVHQIELEMQNEQLREVAGKLEVALERHDEFYDFAPVGYLSLQPDGTIRQVNLTTASMLGRDRSHLLNRRLAVFVSVADRLAVRDWLDQVFAGQDPEVREVSLLLEGKPPLAVALRACLSVDGQECRVVLTDLTARRQAEAARRESEARFRALFDRAPDGILLLSPGGNLIALNEAFARMHGYTVAEMRQMNLRNLDTHETQQLLPERMRRLLAGEALTFEVEHYHQDGRIVPLEVSATWIRNGGETYVQAIHRDITERRQMEAMFQARLRLSEYAHNHTLDELLTRTLDEAELLTGSARGCFQFVAANQKTLSHQTWSTRARQPQVTAAGLERPAPVIATNLWMNAVRERRPLIHGAAAERSPRPGLPATSGRALPESANPAPPAAIPQRELVVPVLQGGRVVALLGVADKSRDYLPTDIESVAQLARLAWDIVLVKQAEAALRNTKVFLDTVIEHSPNPMWVADEHGTLLRLNQACRNSLHLRAEEVVGKYNILQDPVLAAAGHLPQVQAVFAQGAAARFVISYDTGAGQGLPLAQPSRVVLDVSIAPILDGQGKVTNAVIQHTDITERKQAEAALAQSEKRFQTMFEEAPLGVALIDSLTGHICEVNPKFAEIAGRSSAAEMAVLDWMSITHPDDVQADLDNMARLNAGESPGFDMNKRYRRPDGSYVWIHMVIAPMVVADRTQPRHLCMIEDITERRRAEAEIRELNASLEQRVRERTVQLTRANQELEAFSYSVSHDLRAPLRGMDGFARLLQEDYGPRLDAEGNRLIGVVSREAKRMGRLIDDLLAFSRMSREHLAPTPVDMTGLARACFESVTRALPGPGPRFELPPLPPALGDAAMLRQVFENLLGNAVKFSRHQPAPVIQVGFTQDGEETTYYVTDNGAGFDEHYAHKLFGMFQRLHSETEFEGTGVGLALVQRIIHRHGGQVWATGTPGAGATFYFTLPTAKETSL